MGVVSINSININMKFLGLVTLVGLVAAAPQNFQKDSKLVEQQLKNVLNEVGLKQGKLNKAEKIAKKELAKGAKAAEKFAKQNGVTVDFDKIFNQLNKQYGKQATKLVNKADDKENKLTMQTGT